MEINKGGFGPLCFSGGFEALFYNALRTNFGFKN